MAPVAVAEHSPGHSRVLYYRRHLNIRLALRSSNSRRPRRASFALLVVSMGGLGGGGATIIQAGSHSTFFVTLGLAFCQPICGPHLCHPEYKTLWFLILGSLGHFDSSFVLKNTIYLEVIPGAGHYGRWVLYSGGSYIQVPSSWEIIEGFYCWKRSLGLF